jgi:hypothetical protein
LILFEFKFSTSTPNIFKKSFFCKPDLTPILLTLLILLILLIFNVWDKSLTNNPNIKYSEFLHKIATEPNDEEVLKFIGELTSMLQVYYPTIDRFAIANYLYNATDVNGEVKVPTNLSNLKNILVKIEKSKIYHRLPLPEYPSKLYNVYKTKIIFKPYGFWTNVRYN